MAQMNTNNITKSQFNRCGGHALEAMLRIAGRLDVVFRHVPVLMLVHWQHPDFKNGCTPVETKDWSEIRGWPLAKWRECLSDGGCVLVRVDRALSFDVRLAGAQEKGK